MSLKRAYENHAVQNSIGKQALAYLEDSKNKVFTIDVTKTKVSGTQWLEIFQNLSGDLVSEKK